MRTFLAFAWLFTLVAGGYLTLFAPAFEMPDRLAPGCGWLLSPPLTRMVGVALLLLAAAGWRIFRRAQQSHLTTAPLAWHHRQLALLAASLLLLLLASALAPYGTLSVTPSAHCPQRSIANAWFAATGRE
jgi:hypothetical protein